VRVKKGRGVERGESGVCVGEVRAGRSEILKNLLVLRGF